MTDAATEKFAALLRELKQRSGRSYGSLAARLHVSTSTLHRYCNGDAVPASYAPAEHLARLCGATPDELVELHRRWHRAHGTRRGTPSSPAGEDPGRDGGRGSGPAKRGAPAAGAGDGTTPSWAAKARAGRAGGLASASAARGGAGAERGDAARRSGGASGDAAADANGAPAPAPSARDGQPTAPDGPRGRSAAAAGNPADPAAATADAPKVRGSAARSATRPGADSAAKDPDTSGSGDSEGPSAFGGTPASAAVPAPDSAPAPSATGGSGGTALPDGARPAAGARGRWYRRRRVLLPVAGAAAVAVFAVVATASSGSIGEGRAGGGEGPESAALADGSRGGGGAKGGESAAKGGSDKPSERRKPSPAGGGAGGKDRPGAAPRKGGATAEEGAEPAARTPLAWSVRSHVWESGCDHRYVVDKSPGDVPPPPMAQDAEAWASSQGAVHGGTTNIEAAIEPRGDEPVTITAVHVRKTATGSPLPWSAFAMSDGCGGEVTEAAYSVDLDVPRPLLKPRKGGDSTQTWDPPALPYRVTADDPLSLLVYANTEDHDVRWYLEVEWSSGDDSGVVRIDDRGAPFRTSAIKDRPLYGYDSLNGFWRQWPLADDPDQDPASASPAS
ncbi:helix-turn-helix domain-containing protein [Streptomyces sp. 184]|uniref:helix-turn-helix domain-containing protein n=1 Tax=Streptomyces sp. 184 TaxID=1827526 RepID=UPI003891A298